MRNLLVASFMMLAVVAQALAFEFTSWTSDLNKKDVPKGRCWLSADSSSGRVPKNKQPFLGTLSTADGGFTLTVDGNSITLPMTAVPKKNKSKPSTKYRIGAPTPGQMAQLELSVQAILRRKLGDPEFQLGSVEVSTRTSTHKLKSKFRKVRTRLRLSFSGSGVLGATEGRLMIEFKGVRGS